MCVDATPEQLRVLWNHVKGTKASEANFWKQKVSEVFTPEKQGVPTNEKTVVALSVRSSWDLYF